VTSPIWVIDSISSSSLPGHVLICDNWAQHSVIAQMRKDGDDLTN
jgi:hypothetical protein